MDQREYFCFCLCLSLLFSDIFFLSLLFLVVSSFSPPPPPPPSPPLSCQSTSQIARPGFTCDLGQCHNTPNSAGSVPAGNCPQGSAIGTIDANDPDGDALTFVTTSEVDCPFEVGTSNGVIIATRVVNYESRRDWTLKVTVSDPSGLTSDTVDVVISIVNQNDLPVVEGADVVTIREDCQASSILAGCTHQLVATDEDNLGTTSGSTAFGSPLVYTIVANSCGIDVTSAGLLFPSSTSAGYDFESTPTCNFGVTVTDAGSGDTTRTLTVSYLDVNENPSFVTPMTSCQVREDVAVQTTLPDPCVLTGTDPEVATVGQTLEFSATAVADLSVAGNRVLVLQSLDFETTASYTITVQVRDDGPTGTQLGTFGLSSGTQVVEIIDVNEIPTFTPGLIFTVDENTDSGTAFYIKQQKVWTCTLTGTTDLGTIIEGMTVTQVGNTAKGSIQTSTTGETLTVTIISEVDQTFDASGSLKIDEFGINKEVAGNIINTAT